MHREKGRGDCGRGPDSGGSFALSVSPGLGPGWVGEQGAAVVTTL